MRDSLSLEWLCSRIVGGIGDAVMYSDRQGIIRYWNAASERIFGYSAEEALGQSLDLIIPENLRGRHWEGYRRVMECGSSHYDVDLLSTPALCKDGTRISIEFSMALIRDDDGTMQGVAAVIRDVSARWQHERELKERIRSLEASR
jgi:PAS domain S-box-containing protein